MGAMPERLVPKPGMAYLATMAAPHFVQVAVTAGAKGCGGKTDNLEYRGGKTKPGEAEEDGAGSEILR